MTNAIVPGMILSEKYRDQICVVIFVDKFHVHYLNLNNCCIYEKETRDNFRFFVKNYYNPISR